MESSSPARLYCLLVGGVLVIAGIIGFFYEASFETGDEIQSDDVFGILAVNGWHNLVHIAIGLLLLAAAGPPRARRRSASASSTSCSRSGVHRDRQRHPRRWSRSTRGQLPAPDPRAHRVGAGRPRRLGEAEAPRPSTETPAT